MKYNTNLIIMIVILLVFLMSSCNLPKSSYIGNKSYWEKPSCSKMTNYNHKPAKIY